MPANLDLPKLSFVGESELLSPTNLSTDVQYGIIERTSGGGWSAPEYSSSGVRFFTPEVGGYYHFGILGHDGKGNVVENSYSGEVLVVDGGEAADLLSRYDGRIDIVQIDSDISRQAAAQDWRAGIGSFSEFVTFVMDRQEAAGQMPGFSADASKVLFYMQWVSGLWSYGNPTRFDLAGCVVDNEVSGVTDPNDVTVRTFLDSPIGCCTDYTVMMSLLMTAAGIESRVISGAGHVFNEALIDGVWWTIDANLNLAYKASFDDVIDTTRNVEVLRFDHEGMRLGSDIYRSSLASFYQSLMAQLEFGFFESPTRYDARAFVDTLSYGDALLEGFEALAWDGIDNAYVGPEAAPRGWTVGDFDGDGKDDLLRAEPGSIGAIVHTSTGTSLNAAATWHPRVAAGAGGWYVGDFNGDGREDIFAYQPGDLPTSGAFVHLSTGNSFLLGVSWTSAHNGDWGWSVGDFNGDGRDDILRHLNGVTGADVMLSTGTSFAAGQSWTAYGSGSQNWYVGDFNGDGKDDVAQFIADASQTTVFLSTGASFEYSGVWTSQIQGDDAKWHVGDFDGDGLSDLGRVVTDVGFEFLRSTGSGFVAPQLLTDSLNFGSNLVHIGDFTGDGASDVLSAINRFNAGIADPITVVSDDSGFTVRELNTLVAFAPARFRLAEVNSPVSREAADGAWRTAALDTFDELISYVETRRQASATAEHMTGFPAEVARVLFHAQWYAGMWAPGDVADSAIQTVASNSLVGALRADQLSQDVFIDSAIGSASDAAAMLAAALAELGHASAVVTVGPRYVINEFQVGGEWWSVNAQLGVAFRGRWHEIANTASEPETFVFDMASMESGSPTFNLDASQAQRDFITEAGAGLLQDFIRETAEDWLSGQALGNLFSQIAALPVATAAAAWTIPASTSTASNIGDFNGDGRADILSVVAGQSVASISLSTGSGFGAGSSWTTSGSGDQGWYVGDFNGDGRSDIFAVVSGVSGARMLLSDGAKFNAGGSWTTAGSGAQRWYVADFNGDGRDDIMRFITGVSGAQVFLSTGSSFAAVGSWTPAGQGSEWQWFIGDYNGDGRADLGRFLAGVGFQTLLSTGTGFAGPTTWAAGLTSASGLRISDVNGDGLSDLVFLRPGASDNRVLLSNGTSFVASDWSLPAVAASSWLSGDFNGNGADDVFERGTSSGAGRLSLSEIVDTSDILTGVSGVRDTFAVDANSGNDTIIDFALTGGANADQLRIDGDLAGSFSAVLALGSQIGVDAVFTFASGQTLTVKETLLGSFTGDHFIFV